MRRQMAPRHVPLQPVSPSPRRQSEDIFPTLMNKPNCGSKVDRQGSSGLRIDVRPRRLAPPTPISLREPKARAPSCGSPTYRPPRTFADPPPARDRNTLRLPSFLLHPPQLTLPLDPLGRCSLMPRVPLQAQGRAGGIGVRADREADRPAKRDG